MLVVHRTTGTAPARFLSIRSQLAALWHGPRTDARRLFLQHLHDNAGFTHQHHRAIDECADRKQASDNGTHLQHANEGFCAYRRYEGAEERSRRFDAK
jgi:hypothetical protein